MTHGEFLKALKAEKSFLKWLFKSKKKRELKVKELIRKRYGYMEGRFCKIDNIYYYIAGIEGELINPKQSLYIRAILMELCEFRSSMMNEIRGFSLLVNKCPKGDNIKEVESNLISKEGFFNHLKSLVAEMESKF